MASLREDAAGREGRSPKEAHQDVVDREPAALGVSQA